MKPTPTDTTSTLCLPGQEKWELWKNSPSGWQRIPSPEPATGPAGFKAAYLFAYPVSSTFAAPIRAATGDPDLLPSLVEIQLEKQGLKPDAPVGCLTDWRIVEREENQTLVCAAVLNPSLADDLPREAPQRFELSPYLYDLPDNSLVVWKELGRLVFAVTRAEHPIYFHALSASILSPGVVQEIEQLMMPLYMQGLIPELDAVVLWTEADPSTESAFTEAFGTRVNRAPHPAPRPGNRVSAIEPVSVAYGKIRAARARRVRKIVTACVAAYLLLPAFFAGKFFLEKRKLESAKARVADLERNFGHVQATLDQARLADAAINFETYPVEWLFQSLKSLYDSANPGIRITGFEIEKGTGERKLSQITIKGEAANSNMQAAILYQTKVKGDPQLQIFNWNYKTLSAKDGRVPFEIVGITKDDSAETQ